MVASRPKTLRSSIFMLFLFGGPFLSLLQGQVIPAVPQVTQLHEGNWQGELLVGLSKIAVVVKIKAKAGGQWVASLDSPSQFVSDIAIDSLSFQDGLLHFGIQKMALSFDGKFDPATATFEGQFRQGGAALPLTLRPVQAVPKIARPQNPVPPYPYQEREITLPTRDGFQLAGTLTLPPGQGKWPAVILVSGSGPQDRDETIMGHKPFLILADHLTRLGIAVLRLDDRGVGQSTGDFGKAVTEDFADDILQGFWFLRTCAEIDPDRIGLVGHSEGGLVSSLVAQRESKVAFLVLWGSPAVPGEEILFLQMRGAGQAKGITAEEIEAMVVKQKAVYAVIKGEPDNAKAKAKIYEIYGVGAAASAELGDRDRKALETTLGQEVGNLLSPWFRHFLVLDPAVSLRSVRCPVLAVTGEKDIQVPAVPNLQKIEELLGSPKQQVRTVRLPGLNHLLQTCSTGLPEEYGKIEETIAPAALQTISQWILQVSKRIEGSAGRTGGKP